MRRQWAGFAVALLAWPSVLAAISAGARTQPALRVLGLIVALALPAAGVLALIRGFDVSSAAGRRLRLWAHLATVAPVVATALRVAQGLPQREAWLALFGAPFVISLLRSWRENDAGPTGRRRPPEQRCPPPCLLFIDGARC